MHDHPAVIALHKQIARTVALSTEESIDLSRIHERLSVSDHFSRESVFEAVQDLVWSGILQPTDTKPVTSTKFRIRDGASLNLQG
jgi:hypothetical protein